jgi:hypothetical protein
LWSVTTCGNFKIYTAKNIWVNSFMVRMRKEFWWHSPAEDPVSLVSLLELIQETFLSVWTLAHTWIPLKLCRVIELVFSHLFLNRHLLKQSLVTWRKCCFIVFIS